MLILAFSLFLTHNLFAQTKTESQNVFAKSYGYVNDFEKILTPVQIKSLTDFLKSSEAKTKNKILIVTIPSITPYNSLNDYSLDLDKYLISKLNIDTSILILISKQLRQIQVRGLNKLRAKVSDQEMKDIVSAYIVPELKNGDYFKALQDGTNQLAKKLE